MTPEATNPAPLAKAAGSGICKAVAACGATNTAPVADLQAPSIVDRLNGGVA